MAQSAANANQMVTAAPPVERTGVSLTGTIPIPRFQQWAPAWFYSALSWLGTTYTDASNATQSFNNYLIGSDVDPYQRLGATRLFFIRRVDYVFELSVAADVNSTAPLSGGARYMTSDAGILAMYNALAASPIFSAVKYAYIPGQFTHFSDIAAFPPSLQSGYDPMTGIRIIAQGSAIAQVVPLASFNASRNEQIYDKDPQIVPVVTALVFDVSQYNSLGATTFVLPVFYTRDVITGTDYINSFESTIQANGATVNCGQTALFPGGPGYDDTRTFALKLESTAIANTGGQTFTTYVFDKAEVISFLPIFGPVQTGVCTLTYAGASPFTIFSNQRIAGFYRDPSWTTCLGIPIYDYGAYNSSFTNTTETLAAPALIYGTANQFLNGGPLQSVLQKLLRATYVLSADTLVTILDVAIAAKGSADGPGLSVTTAALDFVLSATAASTVVNQLAVPVLATVTTTPARIVIPDPVRDPVRFNATVSKPVIGTASTGIPLQNIGLAANAPSQVQLSTTTIQVPLTATVPQAVLAATGIGAIELGTAFPVQTIGTGSVFQAEAAGTILNLMATSQPALAPFSLSLAATGVSFTAGVTYTFSLIGSALAITGSDGSTASAVLAAGANTDTTHNFIGMAVYAASSATVPLYPLLALSFPAPTVGTAGVLQGVAYTVRLTYGATSCTYDIIDSTQTIVAAGVSVATPKPADNSVPQPGAFYFGGFTGGGGTVTVWSIPVFLPIAPTQLPGAAYNGTMTVGAQVSGLPGYDLNITDSSLFVYSNIDIDTGNLGSVSPANVYLASAAINSAPDDDSPQAFAPCKLVMGIIRQVQMGNQLTYVFIPEDDSVIIGGQRYMLSVINLGAFGEDPNALPYPPSYWWSTQFWQFANRHNPYLAVPYAGATETARLESAAAAVERIGAANTLAREPMQLFIDTDESVMTVWPIYAFPYATATQTVDQGQLRLINTTILGLLATTFPPQPIFTATELGEQILLPSGLARNNPYTYGVGASVNPAGGSPIVVSVATAPAASGQVVTNLSPNTVVQPGSATATADAVALAKSRQPALQVVQAQFETQGAAATQDESRRPQPIYGYSVFNPTTGEAYIVEIVNADLTVPTQLPITPRSTTYDPYYVRVVFLNSLTCYNMSIIVPSMARDQYQYLAQPNTAYQNLLSKTEELGVGYIYQLADTAGGFDTLDFIPFSGDIPPAGASHLYTNLPYQLGRESDVLAVSTWFICRRQNWNVDCHLMRATRPDGKSIFLAFGAGDLVPMRLDAGVTVDARQPAHMVEFSYKISDKHYDSAQTLTIANVPYFVGVTTFGGIVTYTGFSISANAGTTGVTVSATAPLSFPPNIYVVGAASTTFTTVAALNLAGPDLTDTGAFANQDAAGNVIAQQFQIVAYNNLVYLVRAVTNAGLAGIAGGAAAAGLLIDTFVPANGTLALAQAARYKQSGLQYFGSTYTPTTMVDTLDQLDFTSITGQPFFASTIFIPIPELDSTKGFIVNLSDFLGQQIWTIIYPEIIAQPGAAVNGVSYPNGYNLDPDGKPILSLQKLHFVYDPLAVLFTPNDLTHKYPLQPKQQVLALTNGQIREGICWRTANVQPNRLPPSNICAQQILPAGWGMDRTNIIYSSSNRAVRTASSEAYKGLSVNSFISVSGAVYNIEESAMQSDQTGAGFISQVSSISNMLIGVLFDFDNDELGTLSPYNETLSTKGVVFINGYLGAAGYNFSSPDHFDVNDILPCQVPLLDEIADILGYDVAFYNIDASEPQQYWTFAYDGFTAPGLPNYIANVPPSPVDPSFSNRTRSLILIMQNPVRPQQLGLIDTYSSVVSANLHLQNGITGAIFISKKADRDIAYLGSGAAANTVPLYGLPAKYDFFIFSRDHYATLQGCSFLLIDQGYAMCLVDDGTGAGTKVARYAVDSDGNYNELYTYALYSPSGAILESSAFTLKVTLGSPANLTASPPVPETPNSVNPQDLVTQINKVSNLIYAAFGASSPGQPAAYIPIQTVGGNVQAAPIVGPPGFNGYALNVAAANRQPVQISQIYYGNVTYPIAGSTTIIPMKAGKAIPYYGSLSHGLDELVQMKTALQSADLTSFIPRATVPPAPAFGTFGGNGLGALIGAQPFSGAFQGCGAIPPAIASNPTPGTTMKADDSVFYTFNAVTSTVMDTTGKPVTAAGTQYFIDQTDPANPIYGVISLPKFTIGLNTYTINVNTTLADGVTSRYTLIIGGQSYLFDSANQVTANRTLFTFNAISGGLYTVTFAALDAPAVTEAPTPITLTPFSMTAGGLTTVVDVFNNPGGLKDIVLGVTGRLYTYDPVQATVTIAAGTASTTAPVQTGITFVSNSFYGYVIGFTNAGAATGQYTVNGTPMFPYNATTSGSPASYPIMTAPEMFTLGGNFYTFDQDASGDYLSVTGNGQTIPVNPYQFSLDGTIFIINTNVQPYTVVGGGSIFTMTANNTQFVMDGVQYTITPKAGALNGATISGQFNIAQANVVVLENYVYELDIMNGQIVGNGLAYPLTSSGFTYTITTANQSFTVTTAANAVTVTIGGIVYQINNTTVVGDGVTYPILTYRTFADGALIYQIGLDGTAAVAGALPLSAATPPTFTDGATTYTVNALAAFDGTNYYLISGTPAAFTVAGNTYQLRTDGVSISAGPVKTFIATTGPLRPTQFQFGNETLFFGRPTDIAAFDGANYYAIASNAFTDTATGATYTLAGNTAVHLGNSYEIYSNLGQGAYFEVPGGKTYFVNVAVADTGTASGTIYQVFPITAGAFTIPLQYTITASGSTVTVNAVTFAAATAEATLTAAGGTLTGGFFKDPVTNIVYTCIVDAGVTTFIDSNNTVYPYPAPGTTDVLTAMVVVNTGVTLAVETSPAPVIYPVINGQFIAGTAPATTTYTINLPVAYANTAGPYWPVVNGRFIVPQTAPVSSIAYTVRGASVIKGYLLSNDDAFSADGDNVYTVNATTIVKATNQATLSGSTLNAGSLTYTLNTPAGFVSTAPAGVTYNTASSSFAVSFNGVPVTFTLAGTAMTDNRNPANSFPATLGPPHVTFTDTVSGVTFTFNASANNPVTAEIPYTNNFFLDPITGTTYYIDTTNSRVEAISYLPETTQYAFTTANGTAYIIDYSSVQVAIPVIAGANVNAGITTVGTDVFTVEISQIQPTTTGAAIPANQNAFNINGNLYTITGTPNGASYASCSITGDAISPKPFLSANTFTLSDPSITYTLHLDANNLPLLISASFPVKPSRDLISVNDKIYLITYNSVSTGSLLGQGQAAIPITGSAFKLSNPFDTTIAKFVFDDLDIYDAASVVGQFTIYLAPTFFIGTATYTLNTADLLVTDNNGRPYPLIANPTMFSINGFNYVIDTNRVPHAIIGNGNVSPLSTDVTVQNGLPVPNSTFTLNGLIYAYVEDAQRNLLAITGVKLYPIAQPALTFKLDSSLIFSLTTTPPAAGNYAGTVVPIGAITAGSNGVTSATTVLNLYAGTNESGGADYFMYKNVLYTLVKSAGVYIAVQKTYTAYAAAPAKTQQQLAVFDLAGTTFIVTDGTTAGASPAAGINPATMWAQTANAPLETQFGLVYGFAAQPASVTRSSTTDDFQVSVTSTTATGTTVTLYNILYTAGADTNMVVVNVPDLLPCFTQTAPFTFLGDPLTVETGGYNAFTAAIAATAAPFETFAGAFKTPLISTDSSIDGLIGAQGDFTLEFWHSESLTPVLGYHPFTYLASTRTPLVYDIDVDFENASTIYIRINGTVMQANTTPPVFSSRWRHFALSYSQPFTILCKGGGFEVADGTNFDFSGDFSIAMTFAAGDVNTEQGLVYKGTGSDNTAPELQMSYRVCVHNGAVTLKLTDSSGAIATQEFTGTKIQPNNFYQVIVVKHTTTAAANTDPTSTDPYDPPFNPGDLASAASAGGKGAISGLPASGSGSVNISGVSQNPSSPASQLDNFLTKINKAPAPQSYTVTISVRQVNDDGTFGNWSQNTTTYNVANAAGLNVLATGAAHLLIGAAFDDSGNALPFGTAAGPGNIRDLYLFNSAINPEGLQSTPAGIGANANRIDLAAASSADLSKAGILGYWKAQYDPNGVINNLFDQTAVAVSLNTSLAYLTPLRGYELEGASLYLNGYQMTLKFAGGATVQAAMPAYAAGSSLLSFNAGPARLEEISFWNMARAPYQILDDMFGRLVPSNEPFLSIYLSGEFSLPASTAPALPMNKFLDGVVFSNAVTAYDFAFTPATLDLIGSPCVGRCGPLITPNLYTPPGVALTVCDTVPYLTSYSVTLNTTTGTVAGEINEAYIYVKNSVLMLYAGKKVGDLTLTWVSQEQGDVQIVGYIEGAPPAPMANLTNKSSYAGATSVTLSAPTSVTLKYQTSNDETTDNKLIANLATGMKPEIKTHLAPFGIGIQINKTFNLDITLGDKLTLDWSNDQGGQTTASVKLDESNKYTVKLQGTMSPYTNDLFMASLNTVTTPSTTPGTPGAKTAILPNPNLGGFTTSNPPAPLPKTTVTDEKFGQRMFVPSPYGQAFVTSQTLDIYQQTLVQSNTVYGFVAVPNTQIPRDINIVSFRLNSQYIRPGCLDGMIGYAYNPATLPTGAQTYTTTTGQMSPLYDGNFPQGLVGHNASYMQIVQAYQIKKQIDQEAFNSLALYNTAYGGTNAVNPTLTPALDFYDEYIWSSRGALQEVKHTYSTTYEEVYTTGNSFTRDNTLTFNFKLYAETVMVASLDTSWENAVKKTWKYQYTNTATASFDIAASFDGIETDTQMRYASNNDAHFVMNFNSMFNQNNQSGIDLVIGSDGLVYQIVPSVTSGAGLPVSNNIDTSQTYMQPQPSYTTGNADGLTGNLQPYDRPGKTNLFRTYAFFLQPAQQNANAFWSTVIDPIWLANSPDPDAAAMRSAQSNPSLPWRLFYRVTYSERFLPPISTGSTAIPQITPVMAVPVLNPATDFLFQAMTSTTQRPAHNPANDIESNIVLAAPTQSGLSAGAIPTTGPGVGLPVQPNNVIGFDLLKTAATIVNWGDTSNAKLLSQLLTSVLGTNIVTMSPSTLPGSTLVAQVADPVNGGTLYSIYTDPNGLTVSVPTNAGITVYQDVNGNPVQYFDGKTYHSLQTDYVATPDGTVTYYIQPPSTYDQTKFNLAGDYDLYTLPGDEWRYFLVSGIGSNMTSQVSFANTGPFLVSTGASGYTGFTIAPTQHAKSGAKQVAGYVLVQGILQYPNLNTSAETFADVSVYKAMALLDTFPIGDPETLMSCLEAAYPDAPFVGNDEINLVFARNITSYFNTLQQGLIPQ